MTRSRRPHRSVAAVLVLALLGAAGCSAGGSGGAAPTTTAGEQTAPGASAPAGGSTGASTTAAPSATPGRGHSAAVPAALLDVPRAVPMMADYDRRNNAAIEAALVRFDSAPWATTDIGVLLPLDELATRRAKVSEESDRRPLDQVQHLMRADQVVAGPAASGTALALVLGPVRPLAQPSFDDRYVNARVMLRQRPDGPWLNALSIEDIPTVGLPRLNSPGAPSSPTAADLTRLERVRAQAIDYLANQQDQPDLDVESLMPTRQEIINRSGGAIATLECAPPPARMPGTVAVWRAAEGAVGAFALSCTLRAQQRNSMSVTVTEELRKALGLPDEDRTEVELPFVLSSLVFLPDTGTATAVGNGWGFSMPIR